MPDFVRVKSKTTGHEYTTNRTHANNTDDLNIIANKLAVNLNGDPLPPKYRTTYTNPTDSDAPAAADKPQEANK